ncbi:hypothetical protein RJT34_00886 [Clitoria ternatea]|uniref:Uncharacterized protein n=1 Tax=Clitoria ternatea TaxID=43366 RepID=A0AAN9Q307_CLITE
MNESRKRRRGCPLQTVVTRPHQPTLSTLPLLSHSLHSHLFIFPNPILFFFFLFLFLHPMLLLFLPRVPLSPHH